MESAGFQVTRLGASFLVVLLSSSRGKRTARYRVPLMLQRYYPKKSPSLKTRLASGGDLHIERTRKLGVEGRTPSMCLFYFFVSGIHRCDLLPPLHHAQCGPRRIFRNRVCQGSPKRWAIAFRNMSNGLDIFPPECSTDVQLQTRVGPFPC